MKLRLARMAATLVSLSGRSGLKYYVDGHDLESQADRIARHATRLRRGAMPILWLTASLDAAF